MAGRHGNDQSSKQEPIGSRCTEGTHTDIIYLPFSNAPCSLALCMTVHQGMKVFCHHKLHPNSGMAQITPPLWHSSCHAQPCPANYTQNASGQAAQHAAAMHNLSRLPLPDSAAALRQCKGAATTKCGTATVYA